jgi:conjugal transfer/entry exclusion protein
MYWYDAATRMERLYNIQKEKLDYYYKITGVQATSIQDLQVVYENKLAIDTKLRTENENKVNDLKKQVKVLKLKNTILTIGVGGLALTTAYFAIF